MIREIKGTGEITVSGNNTNLPYITPNIDNPIQGMIRINKNNLEVFNNICWQQIHNSYITVALDQDVLDVIRWARKKRDDELEIERLAKDNIAVNDLLSQIKEKQYQAKMILTLLKKEETV